MGPRRVASAGVLESNENVPSASCAQQTWGSEVTSLSREGLLESHESTQIERPRYAVNGARPEQGRLGRAEEASTLAQP